MKFAETVAVNRGLPVMVFRHRRRSEGMAAATGRRVRAYPRERFASEVALTPAIVCDMHGLRATTIRSITIRCSQLPRATVG
jgi:hypothetical protein